MTGRGDMILAFLAASAIHVGAVAFGLTGIGGGGAGDGGHGRISLAAASPSVSAMALDWDRQPEASNVAQLAVPKIVQEPSSDIRPDAAPTRLSQPDLPSPRAGQDKAPGIVTTPQALATLPAVETFTPSLKPDDAQPERTASPELVMAALEMPRPDLNTTPPNLDLAPRSVDRPTPRPPKPDTAQVARQVAAGFGKTGAEGSSSAPAAKASDGERQAASAAWAAEIQRMIARHQAYPRGARDEGRVRVAMVILADGRLSKVSVSRSSGASLLDQAALDAVKRAAPFPPAPKILSDQWFDVGQWITFERK